VDRRSDRADYRGAEAWLVSSRQPVVSQGETVNSIAPSGPRRLVGVGDDVPFELRLAQTIAWCVPRARVEDPSGSLRDVQLGPRVLEVDRATVVRSVVGSRERNVPFDLPPVQRLSDLKGDDFWCTFQTLTSRMAPLKLLPVGSST
jgi:hypothetical protein